MFDSLSGALRVDPRMKRHLSRILWECRKLKKYDEASRFTKSFLDRDAYSYLAWFNLAQVIMYATM